MKQQSIEIDPNVHFGKPCVAGTRIPVQDVLELVREWIPFQTITQDYYPALTFQDIQACVDFAMQVMAAEDIHLAA